jgi:hypothetical protein
MTPPPTYSGGMGFETCLPWVIRQGYCLVYWQDDRKPLLGVMGREKQSMKPSRGSTKYIPLSFDVNLRPDDFVAGRDSPFAGLTGLQDRRGARGLRHALVTASVSLLLARLCGADHLRGMARSLARLELDNTERLCYNRPCEVLVQQQLGVMVAFLRPVRVAKHQVADGQVPRCVLSRTLVRSRERDLCSWEKKITSFSMKQTSAPRLGGARGGAPAPPVLTGAHDGRPSDERDRPLFLRKTRTSQPSKQTSVLCLPLVP